MMLARAHGSAFPIQQKDYLALTPINGSNWKVLPNRATEPSMLLLGTVVES